MYSVDVLVVYNQRILECSSITPIFCWSQFQFHTSKVYDLQIAHTIQYHLDTTFQFIHKQGKNTFGLKAAPWSQLTVIGNSFVTTRKFSSYLHFLTFSTKQNHSPFLQHPLKDFSQYPVKNLLKINQEHVEVSFLSVSLH